MIKMSAINKINDLIKKLESGDVDFIKKFQDDFIVFEKEYDRNDKPFFLSNTFDYYVASDEIFKNSKDKLSEKTTNSKHKLLEELTNKKYFSLAGQNNIQKNDDKRLVLAA